MLESKNLLILPWEASTERGEARRWILAAHDRLPLGFAARPRTQARDYLGVLFGRRRGFDIHEAEDESLLARLLPFGIWKTRWHVLDADNRLVGLLHPPEPGRSSGAVLLGSSAFPAPKQEAFVLMEDSESPGPHARFANSDRRGACASSAEDLGWVEGRANEQCLCFSAKLDKQPLLKLLLLSAVLIARD
jgi:hypothetical protein